eukprot:8409136-Pyramimonas_sp.AAC.1
MVVLHTVRSSTELCQGNPSGFSAVHLQRSRASFPNTASMSIGCRFSVHSKCIARQKLLGTERLSLNTHIIRHGTRHTFRIGTKNCRPTRQQLTHTRCEPYNIEIRPAKRQELRRVADILSNVFQAEHCTGMLGWASLRSIRNEIQAGTCLKAMIRRQ